MDSNDQNSVRILTSPSAWRKRLPESSRTATLARKLEGPPYAGQCVDRRALENLQRIDGVIRVLQVEDVFEVRIHIELTAGVIQSRVPAGERRQIQGIRQVGRPLTQINQAQSATERADF